MDSNEIDANILDNDEEYQHDGGENEMPSFNFGAAVVPRRHLSPDDASSLKKVQQLRDFSNLVKSRRRAKAQISFRGSATAWIDQDDSGTYDPKRRRATRPSALCKNRKRNRNAEEQDEDEIPKMPRCHRAVGCQDIFTFTFTSEKALAYLRSITPGPVNSGTDKDFFSAEEDDSGYGGSFPLIRTKRRRKSIKTSTRQGGLTINQLTVGHPQRRGCKSCFESGIDGCTLVEDGMEYPCQACIDAGIGCKLVIPPKLKRVCEKCKAKRISCSFRIDYGKGVDTCEACKEDGLVCIAGPLNESSRRIDEVVLRATPERQLLAPLLTPSPIPSPPPVRERMYKNCNQCRMGDKNCTLKDRKDFGPCSQCRKAGQKCQFVLKPTRSYPVDASSSKTSSKEKKQKIKPDKRAPNTPRIRSKPGAFHTPTKNMHKLYEETLVPQIQKEQRRREKNRLENKGQTHIFITTSFCHPIKFNYIVDPMGYEPCDWCSNPFFGLVGLGKGARLVEGFYDEEGNGFEEVQGGFSELGAKPSKMCVKCTYERLKISQCAKHQARVVTPDDIDFRVFDDAELTKSKAAIWSGDEETARLFMEAKFCSICCDLAIYKCCTHQTFYLGSLDTKGAGRAGGCGLWLCALCKDIMNRCENSSTADMDGGKMVDTLVKLSKEWIDAGLRDKYPTLRADVDFLTSEGELIIRMNKTTLTESVNQDESKREIVEIIDDPEPTIGTKTSSCLRFKDIDNKESQYQNFKTTTRCSPSEAKTKTDRKGKGKDMSFFEPGPLIDDKDKANTADLQVQLKADREGQSKETSYFEPYYELKNSNKGKEVSIFEPGSELPSAVKKGKAKEYSFFDLHPDFKKGKKSPLRPRNYHKIEGQSSGPLKLEHKHSSNFQLRDRNAAPRRRMSTGRREREREGIAGMGVRPQIKREDVEMASGMAGFVDLTGVD